MAKIQIYGDSNKGCIFFDGSTVEPKFLGTIISTVKADETDRVVIQRTDRVERDGVTFRKLFRRLKATRVQNQAGENLVADLGYSAVEVAEYINQQASNYSAGGAVRPALDEHPNFVLDATSTTIMVDNGENFGVNTLKAVLGADGLVDILSADHSGNAIVHYEDCPHENLQINGDFISGGPQDVINALNELFTVGAFESVVISDPYATMIADVGGVLASGNSVGDNAINPVGDDILASSASHYNKCGWLSSDTIDQAGEYFTFDIRVTDSMGFGLVQVDGDVKYGADSYGDPNRFCDGVANSAHWGYLQSHWFHSGNKGPWTYYGQNTSASIRSGWYNFGTSEERVNYIADAPIKMKVGLDANGYIEISYWDVSESAWQQIQRSSFVVQDGEEFKLGVKIYGTRGRLHTQPKIHLREPEAPVMYFRYIESPDGAWSYPLFATEEESDYYELTTSGVDNGSHQHVYPDDPTNTTWYMPNTAHSMNHGLSPVGQSMTFDGNAINWTEITSLTNADQAPAAFSGADYTFSEDTTVAIQVAPQDVSYTTTVSGLPSGLSLNGGYAIQGTTRHVYGDQDYTVTVTRTNAYGSSQGTFTLTITDDVSQNAISGMTIYGQNPITQSPDTVHHYSGAVNLDVDLSLDVGTAIIWTQQNDSPVGGVGQYLQIGIADPGVDKMTTQLGNNPQHWQVKATIWTGLLNHSDATGWTDSSDTTYAESNDNIQWKLAFPADNGPVELYRDGVLARTSSANFSGSQTLTVGVPVNYSTTTRMPAFTRADINYTGDPPAGFTQEHGDMDDPTTLSDGGVVSLDQVLPVGKRLVVNKTWIETNVLPYCDDSLEKAYIGVPKTTAAWGSIDLHTDFDAVMRWEGQSSTSHKSTIADGSDSVARHESNIGSATNAYYHYAIEWDGTNLTVLRDADISRFSNEHDKYQFSGYSCYENYASQSGDLPLVMAVKGGGALSLTMSGISLVDVPSAPVSNQTPWNYALDFSGSSERAQMVNSGTLYNPMMMGGESVSASAGVSGSTSSDTDARPWATTIVFNADGNNSNQHIWNLGEGSGSSDDNIYLRLQADGKLRFGWGRDGAVNECQILALNGVTINNWHGVYIAHTGARFNASQSVAANLAAAFDIRLMSSADNFATLSGNASTSVSWVSTGNRMDRGFNGGLTIGGRGANRNFHGKVASFVTTTLKRGVAMPDTTEITKMVSDPVKWLNEDKIGNPYRVTWDDYNNASFSLNDTGSRASTQVWLMGDGNMDSYSNMIRNIVSDYDQNYTKLNMISMVSNDIQNVNINGLS